MVNDPDPPVVAQAEPPFVAPVGPPVVARAGPPVVARAGPPVVERAAGESKRPPTADLTAADLLRDLHAHADDSERVRTLQRMTDPTLGVIGVRMGTVFDIAKAHTALPLGEIDRLLDSDLYEARVSAVSVMDFQARRRGVTDEQRRELYDLWMRRIDRMGVWDLIDRSAPRVLGLYLLDKPRDALFALAASPDVWHRRTAITALFLVIRSGDIDDALAMCALLAADPEPFVQSPVGTALREIGRVDPNRLQAFLAERGASLSAQARRVALSGLG